MKKTKRIEKEGGRVGRKRQEVCVLKREEYETEKEEGGRRT